MSHGLQISIPQRLSLLRTVVAVSFIVSMIANFRLWFGERDFPTLPIVRLNVMWEWQTVIALVSAIALLASTLLHWQRLLLLLGMVGICFLVLLDSMRLQHWVFVEGSMLLLLLLYNGRVDDPNNYAVFFVGLQIMLASVYFFTGLYQINKYFIPAEFSAAISPLQGVLSARHFDLLLRTGRACPYLLMFMSVCLLYRSLRYLGITLAALVHVSLIIFLYPLRQGEAGAWASHFCFLAAVFLLFSGETRQRHLSPSLLVQRPLFHGIAIVFVILPFFNLSGNWSQVASSNVYTGNYGKSTAQLCTGCCAELPLYARSFCATAPTGDSLSIKAFALHELGARYFPAAARDARLEYRLSDWMTDKSPYSTRVLASPPVGLFVMD